MTLSLLIEKDIQPLTKMKDEVVLSLLKRNMDSLSQFENNSSHDLPAEINDQV
jgi:hypothetical protein